MSACAHRWQWGQQLGRVLVLCGGVAVASCTAPTEPGAESSRAGELDSDQLLADQDRRRGNRQLGAAAARRAASGVRAVACQSGRSEFQSGRSWHDLGQQCHQRVYVGIWRAGHAN